MRRSRILDGKKQQRSRAKQRKRGDRRLDEPGSGPQDEGDGAGSLDATARWLCRRHGGGEGDEYVDCELMLHEIERLDLDGYLQETGAIDSPAHERLRRLAMYVEYRCSWNAPQPRGFTALDRIYRRALRLCGADRETAGVQVSRAISAWECAGSLLLGDPEDNEVVATRRRLLGQAYSALQDAIARDPDDAHAHFILGRVHYEDLDSSRTEALRYFERASELDPDDGAALLYRAHCLQDLRRWSEAARSYEAVPRSYFTGSAQRRYVVLLEQQAFCSMKAGLREQAIAGFREFMALHERDPGLTDQGYFAHLVAAAAGPLRDALHERAQALLDRLGREDQIVRGHAVDLATRLDRRARKKPELASASAAVGDPDDPDDLESVSGGRAEHDRYEQAYLADVERLFADPEDRDARDAIAVHGDRLQSLGDPRGGLIAFERALRATREHAERRVIEAAMNQYVAEHGEALLGLLDDRDDPLRGLYIEWRGGAGHVVTVDLSVGERGDRDEPGDDGRGPSFELAWMDALLSAPALSRARRLRVRTQGDPDRAAEVMTRLARLEQPWPLEELSIGPSVWPDAHGGPFNDYPFAVSDVRAFLAKYSRLHLLVVNDTVVPLPRRHAEAPDWPHMYHHPAGFDVEEACIGIRALAGAELDVAGRTAIGRALWSLQDSLRLAAIETIATLGSEGRKFMFSLGLYLQLGMYRESRAALKCLRSLGRHARQLAPRLRVIVDQPDDHDPQLWAAARRALAAMVD